MPGLDYGVDFTWRVHAPTLPSLDSDRCEQTHWPVVVIGAGPVGLTVAAGLTRAGVRTLVLEADDAVCRSSRASGISQRTFEILNRVAPGVGDSLAAAAVPIQGSESFFGHRLVLRQVAASEAAAGSKYPANSYLSQWNIEEALVAELERRGDSAEVRWQSRATPVVQDGDGVAIDVSTPLGDYRVRTSWLVGADGSRSAVRESLGLRMTGLEYDVTFVIVDAHVGGNRPPPIRRVWFDPPYLPGGLLLRHMSSDRIWRMDFQLPIGADVDAAMDPENVIGLIRAHLRDIGHDSEQVRPIWISKYQARAISLSDFRAGRILLAGDAAHLVPIFGGFGLNSGIDDADNLQWKLALVAQELAPKYLLDSYSAERIPAIRSSLQFVTRASEFMTPTSVESEALRIAALTLAAEGDATAASLGRHRPARPMPYADSVLVAGDVDAWAGGPRPGEALERGWVSEGDYLPDRLAKGFLLMIFGDLDQAMVAACAEAPFQVNPVAVDTTGLLAERYDADPGTTYLIRPDGVVAARWRRPAVADVRRALASVTRATT